MPFVLSRSLVLLFIFQFYCRNECRVHTCLEKSWETRLSTKSGNLDVLDFLMEKSYAI